MTAIMPQVLTQALSHFPLSISTINHLVKLQSRSNTEHILNSEQYSSDGGMSPLSEIHSSSVGTCLKESHHPDNLDHLRISPNSNNNNSVSGSVKVNSASVNINMERDASGHESDSDVSVGQENESDSSPMSVNTNVTKENHRRDSVDFSEEGMSNDSLRFTSQLCSPQSTHVADEQNRVPTILRPSPTRLHEEFLRNSQMYAEELMRQQMSIVAAAQASTFSTTAQLTKLVTARTLLEEKMGFRPTTMSTRPLNPMPDPSLNFRGIHNHLNAISQITQNLGAHNEKLTSPSPSDTSPSPPVMHTPMHANHAIHAAAMFMNNNLKDHLNQDNLKFSIDNILKADFGRRITEPLMKRSGRGSTSAAKKLLKQEEIILKQQSNRHNKRQSPPMSPQSSIGDRSDGAAMDLTGAEIERESNRSISPSPSGTENPASSSAGSSSDGKGPIVWPAWVYCTR